MKLKSKSSVKKRFKFTGSGKIKMSKVAHNHLLFQKSKKQKRLAKMGVIVDKKDIKRLTRLLIK